MSTFRCRLIPAFVLLLALLGEADGSRPAGEYKFDSPSVLFLGTNRPNTAHPQSRPVRYDRLPHDAALAILSSSDHDWDSPDVMSYGANTEKERALISGEKQRVRRSGKRLTITPASGLPITFTNWSDPEVHNGKGTGQSTSTLGASAVSNIIESKTALSMTRQDRTLLIRLTARWPMRTMETI